MAFLLWLAAAVGFVLGSAWGSMFTRMRLARQLRAQELDVGPVVDRLRVPAVRRRS